jgi:hypothetical protein
MSFCAVMIPLLSVWSYRTFEYIYCAWCVKDFSLIQISIMLIFRCTILDNFMECDGIPRLSGNFIWYTLRVEFDMAYTIHLYSVEQM